MENRQARHIPPECPRRQSRLVRFRVQEALPSLLFLKKPREHNDQRDLVINDLKISSFLSIIRWNT